MSMSATVQRTHTIRTMMVGPLLAAVLPFALIVGCGSNLPPLGRVHGAVTLDGEPLTEGTIFFHPQEGRLSSAKIDPNGHYELVYLRDARGALLGEHRVTIVTAGENSPVERVPEKYNRQSILSADVKKGTNALNFDLHSG